MDRGPVSRKLALCRLGVGLVLFIVPGLVGRFWIGTDARRPIIRLLLRSLGARDLCLGLGLYRASELGRDDQAWLVLGAASDVTDALATIAGWRRLPRGRRQILLGSAAAASLTGLLACRLDPPQSSLNSRPSTAAHQAQEG